MCPLGPWFAAGDIPAVQPTMLRARTRATALSPTTSSIGADLGRSEKRRRMAGSPDEFSSPRS